MPTGSDKITTQTSTSNNSIHNNNDKIITTINQENDTIIDTIGTNGATNESNNETNCGTKLPTGTYDPTPYIQRARVTRPAPPKPSCNPMQFVQIKPCHLYQSAQDQLKRAEEVKKVKEIKKEDAEDWQNNLDNWKSSRRKRVEHIIDRVVEVKKLELEEHDRQRRKSKTFSEMLEERGERKGRSNKLASLTVYTEDEANDLSDLGIGTSSTSGKSSLSEDYDNHSVMSDNVDTEKQNFGDIDNNSNNDGEIGETTRDYISSPGYDTSSSTAPASSPDPCEYTYEGAIQDYKTRVSRATTAASSASSSATTTNYINGNNGFRSNISSPYSKDSTPERTTIINDNNTNNYLPRRMSGSKIEDRLMSFEVKSSNDINEILSTSSSVSKKDLPKVDILKRRELFEKDKLNKISQKRFSGDFSNTKSIRERLSSLEKKIDDQQPITIISSTLITNNKNTNRISNNDINSIKDRLQNLDIKQNNNSIETADNIIKSNEQNIINDKDNISPVTVSIKDRLSSLQNAVTKEEIKKPIMLIDEHQLEILKKEDYNNKQAAAAAAAAMEESLKVIENINLNGSQELLNIQDESNIDTDREDSGIHTTDVSCSVSQTDEQPELVNEDNHNDDHHHINIDVLCDTTTSLLPINNEETTNKENIQLNVVVEDLKNDTIIVEPISQSPPIYDESNEDISTSSTVITPSDEQIPDLESSVSLSDSQSISSSNTIIIDTKKLINNHKGDGHIYENIFVGNNINDNGDKELVVANTNSSCSNSSSKNLNQNEIITNKLKSKSNDDDMSNGRHLICVVNPKNSKKLNLNNDNKSDIVQVKNQQKSNDKNNISKINLSYLPNINDKQRNTNESITKSNKIVENSITIKQSDKDVNNMKRSKTIEEICDKIDIKKIPQYHNTTPYFDISLEDIANCEKNLSPIDGPIVNAKQNKETLKSNQDKELSELCTKVLNENKVFTDNSIKSPSKTTIKRLSEPPTENNDITKSSKTNSVPFTTPPLSPKSINNSIKSNPLVSPKKSAPSSPIFSISPMKVGDYQKLNKPPSTPNSQKSTPKTTPSSTPTTLSPLNSLTRPKNLNLKHGNSTSVNQIPAADSNVQLTVENLDENQKNPGLLVARLEVVETTIKVTSNDNSPLSTPKSCSPNGSIKSFQSLDSPSVNHKTFPSTKPKNIFDFLKKNFNDETSSVDSTQTDNGNSKFYIPPPITATNSSSCSSITSGNTEVNIEITKITKTEKIVEKTDLGDKELNMADELNQYLNKEIKKSITEQTKL